MTVEHSPSERGTFDLEFFRYCIGNPSAWDSYDDAMSKRMDGALHEIERLRAAWQPIETVPKDQEVEVRGIWKLRGDGVVFTHWRPTAAHTSAERE